MSGPVANDRFDSNYSAAYPQFLNNSLLTRKISYRLGATIILVTAKLRRHDWEVLGESLKGTFFLLFLVTSALANVISFMAMAVLVGWHPQPLHKAETSVPVAEARTALGAATSLNQAMPCLRSKRL